MVPLEYNQKLFELFGFCPCADGSAQFATFVKRCTMFWTIIGMDLIPTSHFLYAHFDDPALLISSISPITAFIVVTISYLTFVIEGKRANYTLSYLRALVNERIRSTGHTLYADAEKKAIFITKWPMRITCTSFVLLSILFAAQQILMDWLNGNIDPTHWKMTYKISTPYNQQTAVGFFLVNLQKCTTVAIYFVVLTLVPAYFMGICFYIEAICNDFEMVILDLNNSKSIGHNAIRSTIISVVNLQIYAANLFKQMAKVVTGTVFIQVVGDTIFTSTTLFQLQQTLETFDTEVVMTIFASIVAVVSILPYCYYSSRIVLKMEHAAYAAFETNWYELPVNLQKDMKHIIAFAQLKRSVTGFGLFNSDLGGFMKIIKTALSYFVMFRSFSE